MKYVGKAFGPKVDIRRVKIIRDNQGIADAEELGKAPTKNAQVFFLMDVSGSMYQHTKEACAGVAELTLQKLREDHEKVTPTYVAYTTSAERRNSLKHLVEDPHTGGTVTSRGFDKVIELLEKRKTKDDVYVVLLTDGDNWRDDNPTVMARVETLFTNFNVVGMSYHEVSRRRIQRMGESMTLCPLVTSYVDCYRNPRPNY